MKIKARFAIVIFTFLFTVFAATLVTDELYASPITTADIVPLTDPNLTGSGNGTLDLRMWTFSGSEINNEAKQGNNLLFDGDNGNNTLPQGGGSTDDQSFVESYVTTAGKLKAFYDLNFGPGMINEIVVFLDLNETGEGALNNTELLFDIWLNPTTIQGNPDPVGGDVSSAQQAAINQIFTGGTKLAWLNPMPAANLPIIEQGAGFADYAIFTGINPYLLDDDDVLLFNESMTLLNNGAEEKFLSGEFSPRDIEPGPEPIPEPSSLLLIGTGLAGLGIAAWRRKNK